MALAVLTKGLRDQRRALAGWSVSLAALVLLEGGLWTSVRDVLQLRGLAQSYPEPLRRLFDLDAIGTGAGYFDAELFTLVLPMLLLVYAVSRGARMEAGEEEAGTLELVLVTPLSRPRLLVEKAMALLLGIGCLAAVTGASTLLASAIFGLGITATQAAVGSLSLALLAVEYGWLALALGAMTGHRALAGAVSGAAAVAAYVVHAAGLMVDSLSGWLPWSPFHQALAAGPLTERVPGELAWLALGGVAALAVAAPVLARRDIRTG